MTDEAAKLLATAITKLAEAIALNAKTITYRVDYDGVHGSPLDWPLKRGTPGRIDR